MIVKEGLLIIKFFVFFSLGLFILANFFKIDFFYFLMILCLLFALFSCYFFRNPNRKIQANSNEIQSPCDGTVMEITEEFNEVLNEDCKVVRVFLSVFNVHVQRAPIAGKISLVNYKKGKFLPAMNKEAHIQNEQNLVVFNDEAMGRKILCIQIAGLIARKIVMWKKIHDDLKLGELYGMIKFGSQVDIYMPKNVKILVKKDQKILGGLTTIAEWEQ